MPRWAAWALLIGLLGWVALADAQSVDTDYRVSTESRLARMESRQDQIDTILRGIIVAVAAQLFIQGVAVKLKGRN